MNSKPIRILRKILLPFSWIYGLIIFVRNKLYDWDISKTQSFTIPVVCVGNITVGGTGKTPHTEWLIEQFSSQYNVGVLSRGYGRKSKDFQLVHSNDDASLVGDEPLQMKQKFTNVTFAVDADRRRGIARLINLYACNFIILDDAFQHRRVSATFNILLMDYNRLPHKDSYLPAGNLRDGRYAIKRADCILITKSPILSMEQEQKVLSRYAKYNKPTYFTRFDYGAITGFFSGKTLSSLQGVSVLVVTAIANPQPLYDYLAGKPFGEVRRMAFSDHHSFTAKDVAKIQKKWQGISQDQKIILTTEKDKVKLLPLLQSYAPSDFVDSIYFISIKVDFGKEEKTFLSQLESCVNQRVCH